MDENPYRAPAAIAPAAATDPFSNQLLARQMLEARDRGISLGLAFRWNWKRYVALAGVSGVALAMAAFVEHWTFFWIFVSFFYGCIVRDLGWVRGVRRKWPFTVAVTDWDKVQRFADEQSQ